MNKKNVITFAIVGFVIALFIWTALWVNGVDWSPLVGSTKVAVVVVYIAAVTLVTMGLIGLMEADNEVNPVVSAATPDSANKLRVHYLKLTGSLFLLFGGITLLILVFVPLSFHASVQGVVSLYGMKPYHTPLIKVVDAKEVEVDLVDPADPTKTIPGKIALERITIEETSLPHDSATSAAIPGTIRVTVVIDRDDAIKTGVIVPKKRALGSEVCFQELNAPDGSMGKQSWVAPF